VGKSDDSVRPIRSVGKGMGKVWIINVTQAYDIDSEEITSTSLNSEVTI
jgi:nitrogen regulatory protein PII